MSQKYLSFDKKLRLTLTVIEASNIPKKDLFSESDPFCSVALCHNRGDEVKILRTVNTRTLKDAKNPVWKTRFAFTPQSYDEDYFIFSIHDVDPFVKEAEVGNNSLVPRLKIQICAENFGIDKDIDPAIEETRQDEEDEFKKQIEVEEEKQARKEEEEVKKIEEEKVEEESKPKEERQEETKPLISMEEPKEEPKVEEVPIESPKELKPKLSVAKFAFEGSEGALSMEVGDKFEVLEKKDEWTSVVNVATKISGWVPSEYLEEEN